MIRRPPVSTRTDNSFPTRRSSVLKPEKVDLSPEDLAYLPYTSGTTGPPKGSMNTHSNVVFAAQIYRDWLGLSPGGAMFAVAPLFHITGRSEEHTSELQSLMRISYAVFCLKKKN